ncbi:precorrin-6A reductase [Paenibacillus sp. TRM 82003]|nr:precorrin-6A reductase [Paenibacillus sp. TRM 82003]
MIFMLCGTSDARSLAVRVREAGYPLIASVVTDSAAKSLEEAGIPVRTGRLPVEAMTAVLRELGASIVVDASHPFAEEAHKNAMEAARALKLPYVRLERASLAYGEHPLLSVVASYEEAALEAKRLKGSVMLTTGSKTLPVFAKYLIGDPEVRLVARMLPRKDNMELCEALGVEQRNIIAMQGPFSAELNAALYRQYATDVMVTKESGRVGAVDEKVEAALSAGIRVILISRPELDFGDAYADEESVLGRLTELRKPTKEAE